MPFSYTGLVLPGNLSVQTGVIWGWHAYTCKHTSGKMSFKQQQCFKQTM